MSRTRAVTAVVCLGMIAGGCARSSVAAGSAAVPSNAAVERAVHELVNRHRGAQGLAPLALDARISRAAREHSVAMAAGRTPLGHEGFAERIAALARELPSRASAENVAFNRGHRDPAAEAVRGWLASPAHRRNIEGPYDRTGVGVASNAAGEVYLTQIFLGGASPERAPTPRR